MWNRFTFDRFECFKLYEDVYLSRKSPASLWVYEKWTRAHSAENFTDNVKYSRWPPYTAARFFSRSVGWIFSSGVKLSGKQIEEEEKKNGRCMNFPAAAYMNEEIKITIAGSGAKIIHFARFLSRYNIVGKSHTSDHSSSLSFSTCLPRPEQPRRSCADVLVNHCHFREKKISFNLIS